jgi:hypothetical protein
MTTCFDEITVNIQQYQNIFLEISYLNTQAHQIKIKK